MVIAYCSKKLLFSKWLLENHFINCPNFQTKSQSITKLERTTLLFQAIAKVIAVILNKWVAKQILWTEFRFMFYARENLYIAF